VQEILSKSEERFRSLVTATSQVVWTTNAMGEVVDDLPTWRVFTGQSEKELKGWGWSEAVHREDRQRTTETWKEAVKSQAIYDTEYRLRRDDGEYRHVVARGVPVLEADGSIREWIGTCTDITERKRAEDVLKRYELLSRHAREIILFISQDGRILEANEAACAAYGYDRITILSLTIADLRAPEAKPRIPDQMENAFGKGVFFESKHQRYDGSVFPVEVSSRGVKVGKDRILLSIIRDITERQRAEEEISRARVMLQTVFDGISDPLLMVDKDFAVMMLNEAARRYFEVSDREEAIGKICYEMPHGKCAECDNCVNGINSAISEAKHITFERKDLSGHEHRFEQVTVYPAEEAFTGLSGAIIRISDITESKALERHLMRADRLASLGLLSGGIAHEIRNPLAGINLFIDVLGNEQKFKRTDQELDILKDIKSNVKRIDSIIRRVLSFSSQSNSSLSNLKVSPVIEDTVRFWGSRMRNDGIALELSLAEDLSEVLGDSIEIQQVLNNLVQNALEAMPGGGALSITAQNGVMSFDGKRRAAVITIQDSGPGIPSDLQKNIFNPFFTTKYAGTGLGLSISHRIVVRHGGTLSFESIPDVGTTFTIELPAAPVA